jgi:radical SAM protein with 4Fe4S-binding SPASM domain
LGVQKLVFNRYVGLPDDDCAPNKDQLRQALTDIEAMRISGDAVKLSVTVPQCFHPTSAAGCGAGRTYITIDPRGNVRPCNHSPLILGNLCRESLETILQSKQLESWHNLIPSECRKCSAFDFCGGGCKADTILNQSSKDSLMCRPFHPKEGNQFIVVSENLRPVLNPSFHQDSLPIDMDCQTRHILMNSLDGNITLKELGVLHGQKMLNLIGTMHHAGVIEFR